MGLAVKRIQVIRPETWGVAFPYACDPNDRLTHACDALRPKPKLARVIPITRSQAAESNNAPSSHVEQWHAITKHEHQIWDCLPGGGHKLYRVTRLGEAVQRKPSHGKA